MQRRRLARTAIAFLALGLAAALIFWNWPRLTHSDGEMRDPRSEISAVAIGEDIYIAGGIGFFRTLASCEQYNVRTESWQRCADLPRALHHVAMATDGEWLYASGGYIGLPFQQDQNPMLFVHEPGSDRWEELAALPHPIGQHAMVWRSGVLYLVGGQNGEEDLASLWMYDLETDQWRQGPPMPTARHSHAIALTEDTLYVTGGRSAELGTQIDRIEAFDFNANSWRTLPPMPVGRGGHAAFSTPGQLHIVGGENLDEGTVFDRHDILDLETLEWREGPALTGPRHGLAVVHQAGGRTYALGGGAQAGMRTIYSVTGTIFPIETSQ
ncbi:kelch repeat-containing protein [Parasphingopyxis sp.]|uniref:Kelch repeat-containing protein n=1 Tax=Parasphingopyxis sp. TaxID=1920299 RepID=UPI0026232BC3|nr:kelch repeat-containing protein [Parasphingopyxis sp.]